MSTLFRQAALDKVSNPDQLDRVLRVVRPIHGVGIALVALIVVGGFLWSLFSTAPVSVRGHGILLSVDGVAVVSAPSEGRVERILVDPGESVKAGQTVAMLRLPESLDTITAKRAELQGARDLLESRQTDHEQQRRMQADLLDVKRKALAEQLEKLKVQHDALLQRRRNVQALLDKGFTTASQLNETETRIADLEGRIAQARNERVELSVRQRGEDVQRSQALHEARLRVQALKHELENMEREYERRRTLPAPTDATAVELNVNAGDLVSTGQVIMRLLPLDAEQREGSLRAIVFVPNEHGKKIKPGMDAHIMPSTATLQKDGFIRGEVLGVARIPSSREGIMRRLKNDTLVDTLLRTGAPFEVEVALGTDPSSPSGFLWSSGRGPDISIDVGTIAAADMVVDRRRVISLVLPAFDHVFRWLGVR